MRKIILIRHAETAMAGRFCGYSDPDLNAAGEMQLARIVDQVVQYGIERIVSSDLRRALRTAQAIGQEIGIEPELRPRLREIHFGSWEGLAWNEIEAQFPREAGAWMKDFPMRSALQGESYEDFCKRVDEEFALLLDGNAHRLTAVVTHRGPMRYALAKSFGHSEQEAFAQTADYGAVIVTARVPAAQEALP